MIKNHYICKFASLILGIAFLSACQESALNAPSKDSSISTDSGDLVLEDDETISEPISVAGAFLYCSVDDRIETTEISTAVGCRLMSEDSRPIILNRDFSVVAQLVKPDGSQIALQQSIVESVFWSWIFEVSNEDLKGSSISMTTSDGGVVWGEDKVIEIDLDNANEVARFNMLTSLVEEYEAQLAIEEAKVLEKEGKVEDNEGFVASSKDNRDQRRVETASAQADYNEKLAGFEAAMAAHVEKTAALEAAELEEQDAAQLEVDAAAGVLATALVERDSAGSALDTATSAQNNAQGVYVLSLGKLKKSKESRDEAIAARDKVKLDLEMARSELEVVEKEI